MNFVEQAKRFDPRECTIAEITGEHYTDRCTAFFGYVGQKDKDAMNELFLVYGDGILLARDPRKVWHDPLVRVTINRWVDLIIVWKSQD